MKKLFSFSVVIALVLLSACSNNPTTDPIAPTTNQTPESSSTDQNAFISNICEDENYVYFLETNDSETSIMKCEKDSNEKSTLTKSSSIENLFLDDKLLYYSSGKNIYSIEKDGSNYDLIVSISDLNIVPEEDITELVIYNNYLFIRMSFGLYSYNIETKECREIHWDARSGVQVSKNKLYFCGRDCSISEMDIETGIIKVILRCNSNGDEHKDVYKNFVIDDDSCLYYFKRVPDGIYMYDNGISILIDNSAGIDELNLLTHNGMLYYFNRENEIYNLIQYNPIENKKTVLSTCENFKSAITIVADTFLYRNKNDDIIAIRLSNAEKDRGRFSVLTK